MKHLVLNAIKAYDQFVVASDDQLSADALRAAGRSLRFGLLASAATVAVFLIGGSLAPLESASVLQGSIMPSDYKKAIQHLEGGIVSAILVKDGDEVKEGQPLVRLSKVGASATQGVAATQFFTARVTQARLEALQNAADTMVVKDDVKSEADLSPDLQAILATQQRLFTSDRDAQHDKLAIYDQQIAQIKEESGGLEARLKSTQAQLGYIEEALNTEKGLVSRGLSTRPRLISLQSQDEDLKARVGEITASIGKNEKNAMEITAKISNQKNEYQSKIADELRIARESGSELEKKLTAASDVLERTVITAPISGIVNDLKFHTAGGVIPAGSTIMDIIPKDGLVLVDAQVQPRDISRVHIGQDAHVRFPTYKSRVTPMIEGKVVQVSADRIVPAPASGAPAGGYYLARVEVEKSAMDKLATPIKLTPGMPVEVMAVDGERSLLGYYIKPLLDSFHHAFREL